MKLVRKEKDDNRVLGIQMRAAVNDEEERVEDRRGKGNISGDEDAR